MSSSAMVLLLGMIIALVALVLALAVKFGSRPSVDVP
jgi:hypothetical protein